MIKFGNKIERILAVDSEAFSVRLKFRGGPVVVARLGYLFEHPQRLAAEVLRGGMLDRCFIENGALAWPNGLELCPDSLLAKGIAVTRSRRPQSLKINR